MRKGAGGTLRKTLVVVRREYVQGVRARAFLISTLLAPVFMLFLFLLPGLLFTMKTGGATRLAVVDQTGRMYERVRESILHGDGDDPRERETAPAVGVGTSERQMQSAAEMQTRFEVEQAPADGPIEEVKKRLSERVLREELDAYLVLPADILARGEAEFYARNTGDVFTIAVLENRLGRAVIEQRMRDENIDQRRVAELSREVRMETARVTAGGEQRDSGGGGFFLAVGVGSFILIAILMYGQAVLSAVVEEKTTRIVEILFSSVRAFPLMAGKLFGVSLVAMTQFAVWALMFLALALYGAAAAAMWGMELTPPAIQPLHLVYALLFFALGFYVYATIYAVVGAVVTTEKEASQIILPVSMLPVVGIYLAFPVIRSPNSAFSFWVSMVPLFSPITMLVRVVTETPPFWQIALSLALGFATVVGMVWFAARVYRTGMLMYGKRATIPEILRWLRQP
ncbi:MAG TPA: ABC transporter permease [Pyrinomonadaceae bacterium]